MNIQKYLSPSLQKRSVAIGILLGFVIFVSLRSCSLFENTYEMRVAIGQEVRWSHLHVLGKERDLIAFNSELLKAIAQTESFRVSQVAILDPLAELDAGHLQGVLTSLFPTDVNKKRYLFSEPYFQTGLVLVLKGGIVPKQSYEARRKIIGIQKQMAIPTDFQQYTDMQFKIFDDVLPALSSLEEGKIDGVLLPAIVAHAFADAFYKNEFKIEPLPITMQESIRLVTLKNTLGERLIEKFNEGLKKLKDSGVYKELLLKWGLLDVEPRP